MEQEVRYPQIIINYLISNELKTLGDSYEKFPHMYNQLNLKFGKFPLSQLEALVTDLNRLRRIKEHRWFIRDVELKYVGGWPYVGDLPQEWCYLSVIDIASKIKENPHVQSLSINRITKISKNSDLILDLVRPILVRGGEIRKDRAFQSLPFESDDGSHRCIGAALVGKSTIRAFVGMP